MRRFVLAVALPVALAWPALTVATKVDDPVEDTVDQQKLLRDMDITDAIERDLRVDPGVPFDGIDVETDNGIVMLDGTVPYVLARDRSAEIAQGVKGVRSVVNRIVVKPPPRDDADVERDVREALLVDPATGNFAVHADVTEGVVTLTGATDSWAGKQLAAETVKGVKGVRAVRNDIDVEYTADRSDEEIADEIRQRLEWDVRVDGQLLHVDVNHGDVVLTGAVGSAADRSRAFSDAWVAGVRTVDDERVEVQWWARTRMRAADQPGRTDRTIRLAVRAAFLHDPRVVGDYPDVEVRDGRATLRGVVDSISTRQAAEEDARNTVGVLRVESLLKVRPIPATDTQLVERVTEALARNPYLDQYQIGVAARSGVVRLSGDVDTAFAARVAGFVASHVNGVVDVVNALEPPRTDVPTANDRQIRDHIEDQLFWSPFVDADEVLTTVHNGVATLSGTVDSMRERNAAEENAYEGGAVRVVNDLHVKGFPDGAF